MYKKLILPVLLLVSLAGCSAKEYDWVVKIQGQPVAPHTYVAAQMHSYIEAQPLADDGADVLHSTIDGVDGRRWIENHTLEKLKRDYFINREFENRNLKFASQAEDFIKMFGEEGWENVKDIYTNNGLDLEDYLEYLKSLYKEQMVFNDIFLNGEDNPVTDREIDDYLDSNLCRARLFKVARVNDDGSAIDRRQSAELEAIVAGAVDKINSGEDMAQAAGVALTEAGRLLGSSEDFSQGADFVSTVYISNSNINLIYDFMADFFIIDQGVCVYYILDDCYYICQKVPLVDTQVEYMYMKQDVANIIRDAEFEDMIARAGEKMDVEYNREAVAAYSLGKIRTIID